MVNHRQGQQARLRGDPGRPPPPVEIYTPERKAEFLLSNAIDAEDYAWATDRVRARSGRCRLLASRDAIIEEARRNLGDPVHLAALARLLQEVTVVDEPPSGLRCPIVFLAALAAGATVAGMLIQMPAAYLGGSA